MHSPVDAIWYTRVDAIEEVGRKAKEPEHYRRFLAFPDCDRPKVNTCRRPGLDRQDNHDGRDSGAE